jgi:HK97 gp10 family phage protein
MAVKGNREVARALRELARQVSVPLNATSRFALQPTLKRAKANVLALPITEDTGTLANSLVIKRKARSSKLAPVHQVGPDASVERWTKYGFRRPVKYAHLVEFGTAPHYQPKRGVMHPGTRPRPFMTPAYFATRDQVVKRFGAKIGPEMEKRAARLRAKGK